MSDDSVTNPVAGSPYEASPIIVLGMHRSGTSLITRLLERLGLFVGARKEANHEAVFFQRLNRWMMHQCGARWDAPSDVRYLIETTHLRELTVEYLRDIVDSRRSFDFLGSPTALRTAQLRRRLLPWGWKDPRNTYLLPIWRDVFPNLRVIHVLRHGVDVAASLKAREDANLAASRKRYQLAKRWYWLRPKRGGFVDSPRCATLDGGFSLWLAYCREARTHVEAMGKAALEIRYEGFLANPGDQLAHLAAYCQLVTPATRIAQAVRDVQQDRALAYRRDPALKQFAQTHHATLAEFGYTE